MDIESAFPSKYLKAADVPRGAEYNLAIQSCELENVAMDNQPREDKPVLHFQRAQKGLVLNKTNADVLSAAWGRETTAWIGQQVVIRQDTTKYMGKTVPCLRLEAITDTGAMGSGTAPPPVQPEPAPTTQGHAEPPAPAAQPQGPHQTLQQNDIPF